MKKDTTITILKTDKRKCDTIRDKANLSFKAEFSIEKAFKQSEFFSHIIKYLEANEEAFIDYIIKPCDSAFWKVSS